MGIILQPSNFTGYQQAVNDILVTPKLQASITRWEKWYLNQMLSLSTTAANPVSVATLFITDCEANFPNPPTELLNLNIYNPLAWQVGRRQWQSRGMVDILTNLIFGHYVRDKGVLDSVNGAVAPNVDAGKKLTMADQARFGYERYNSALDDLETLYRYLRLGDGTGLPGHGGQIDYPQYIESGRHFIKAKYTFG